MLFEESEIAAEEIFHDTSGTPLNGCRQIRRRSQHVQSGDVEGMILLVCFRSVLDRYGYSK